MKNVAILISGSGSNMVTLAQSMRGDHPARPCVVLSNRPDAGGLAKAQALGIPTVVVDHKEFKGDRAAFDAAVIAALDPYAPDVVALAGFMRILTPEFITHYAGKMLNIHPSLLPKYKGLHTHQRAIEAGDAQAGCSVHEVTAELDGGPILAQERVDIAPDDTAETLAAKILPLEHKIYPETLRSFVSGAFAARD
ncbi:phosphoribosylglycinamide formyltransferase [Pacificibacter marinus]|uniref:Phosphoribosylglycinamide formyltransferase n=1 Tax=Pacificibacter marinus TaxID=658057 RepID=A0A1Y5T336_9RHOB|nr:phosphoribosylglycinamide formyltransferase [Pacificibacter marinus]SEK96621.1 formyltetrahydrofolate-dependent phosphoribosylglycinamide formyltransferase [Pacificibacter marinus]SLN53083.1 Phosphoribosylglycinamide formyltransferase [Pacificibacter marinus]